LAIVGGFCMDGLIGDREMRVRYGDGEAKSIILTVSSFAHSMSPRRHSSFRLHHSSFTTMPDIPETNKREPEFPTEDA
jgi:hypothetical protein